MFKKLGENLENQALDFDQLMAAMHLDAHERRTVGMIGREAPKLVKRMVAYDPLSLAATFAGLLTVPDLQSNCPRLEMLIHQSLGSAKGRKKADAAIVRTAFDIAGEGRCGRLEDPAEDLFVRNITTKRGNFRIIEGIWESGGFYLQRVVNVVEMMPDVPVFNEIRDSVYALLGVSEMVCERAGLSRYELGETSPHEKFPGELTGMIGSVRNRVCFTQAELKAAGIDHEHLIPFVFDPRQRAHILEDEFINARLERWATSQSSLRPSSTIFARRMCPPIIRWEASSMTGRSNVSLPKRLPRTDFLSSAPHSSKRPSNALEKRSRTSIRR